MHITSALSYGNAWKLLVENHNEEFVDIKRALSNISDKDIDYLSRRWSLVLFGPAMRPAGWHRLRRYIDSTPFNRNIAVDRLGFLKNRVSVASISHAESLNRWLYIASPIGVRDGVVDIPIALVPAYKLPRSVQFGSEQDLFTSTRDELLALSPLSHQSPFLILGVSVNAGDMDVVDLMQEQGINFRQIIINRSIEFPPQYHQAGLGVLTYFGTVLREKYPNHDAKVRIEQDGLKVRLIVESSNGDREIIEKALQEYQMVVVGDKSPDDYLPTAVAVLNLKNELRIAQLRAESQREIISLQNANIISLQQLLKDALCRHSPIELTVKPSISISNVSSQSLEIANCIPEVSNDIHELLELVNDPSLRTQLLDLSEALDNAASNQKAEGLRQSKGLSKLRSFVEDATRAGTKAHAVIEKIEDGFELIQNIGKKYNAIAQWCGAPQIPTVLLE